MLQPDHRGIVSPTGDTASPPAIGETMETTPPVAALTIIGILLAVLGLFVAGSIVIVAIGLLSIFGAGVLQVAGRRR